MKEYWGGFYTTSATTGATGDWSIENLRATAKAMESLRLPRTFAVLSAAAAKQFRNAGPVEHVSEAFGIPVFIEDDPLERFAMVRNLRANHVGCVVIYENTLGQVVEVR